MSVKHLPQLVHLQWQSKAIFSRLLLASLPGCLQMAIKMRSIEEIGIIPLLSNVMLALKAPRWLLSSSSSLSRGPSRKSFNSRRPNLIGEFERRNRNTNKCEIRRGSNAAATCCRIKWLHYSLHDLLLLLPVQTMMMLMMKIIIKWKLPFLADKASVFLPAHLVSF